MAKAQTLKAPQRVVDVEQTTSGLPVGRGQKPSPKFVYAHYPRGWAWEGQELGFLPVLSKILAVPGVNGCTKDGNLNLTLARVVERGGTVIAPRDPRLGEYQNYVSYYDTTRGGKWYVDWCQSAEVLASGQILWETQESAVQLKAFRKHLRDAGIVEPLSHGVYRLLEEQARAVYESILSRSSQNPAMASKADAALQSLTEMQAGWKKHNEDLNKTAPAKKPLRRIAEEE